MSPATRRGFIPRSRGSQASNDPPSAVAGRGGRPSGAQAERITERILDAATHLFLTHGYGDTSIEAVAQRARTSKRTFYHRFDDKPALFSAVVRRIIDRLRPPSHVPLLDGDNLQDILRRLAGLILRAALSEEAIALHRLIVAESGRFPQLAGVVAEQGTAEALRLIGGVLEREASAGNLQIDHAAFAAEQFLHMVVDVPQQRALGLGTPMTAIERETWANDVVNLFLNGCRGWVRASG